jgi:hypothetical protein
MGEDDVISKLTEVETQRHCVVELEYARIWRKRKPEVRRALAIRPGGSQGVKES